MRDFHWRGPWQCEPLQMVDVKFRLRQLELVREMRRTRLPTAPVDVIGCDRLAEASAPDAIRRFQCLVALMLSSQTKDQVTASAMDRLKAYAQDHLHRAHFDPETLRLASEDALAELLKPVGFYRIKARSLKRTGDILKAQYQDDIPRTLEELVQLPGVGPKMVMRGGWRVC